MSQRCWAKYISQCTCSATEWPPVQRKHLKCSIFEFCSSSCLLSLCSNFFRLASSSQHHKIQAPFNVDLEWFQCVSHVDTTYETAQAFQWMFARRCFSFKGKRFLRASSTLSFNQTSVSHDGAMFFFFFLQTTAPLFFFSKLSSTRTICDFIPI